MIADPKVKGRVVKLDKWSDLKKLRSNKLSNQRSVFSNLFHNEESGAILVIGVIVAVGMAMASISVANIGIMVAEKMHLQDTVDAATYSAAVAQARYMNLNAYISRSMIANYSQMAFNTSVWAVIATYDHGVAAVISMLYILAGILQFIPIVQAAAAPVDTFANVMDRTVHTAFHEINPIIDNAVCQDNDDCVDFNNILEMYNTEVLSNIQGLTYGAIQSARYQIAKEVAAEMDDEVRTTSVMGLGAETITADELKKTVDWVIRDPDERSGFSSYLNDSFNEAMGTDSSEDDHPLLLGAVAEASLDKFSIGRDRDGNANLFRGFNLVEIIPNWIQSLIEAPFYIACIDDCIADWVSFEACDCDPTIDMLIGSGVRWGEENSFSESRVPVIARQRMREANMFGLDFQTRDIGAIGQLMLNQLPLQWGYTSGERHNDIGNYTNGELFMLFDEPERWIECLFNSGSCNLNKTNDAMSKLTQFGVGTLCTLISSFEFHDEHWDATFDSKPTCAARYYNFQNVACIPSDQIPYITDICSEGAEIGVPKYDWEWDVDNVGFSHYIYDESESEARPDGYSRGDDDDVYAGPTVSVFALKEQEDINGLTGLGIGNEYSMSAYARAQVYYLKNANRPSEKPSMFNPHWVARLAPVDVPDSPDYIEEGMPFLSSFGVPIKPTH